MSELYIKPNIQAKEGKSYDQIYYKEIVKNDIKRTEYIKLCNRLNRLLENTIKKYPECKDLCNQIKNNENISTYDKLRKIKIISVNYEFDLMKLEFPEICLWKKRGVIC